MPRPESGACTIGAKIFTYRWGSTSPVRRTVLIRLPRSALVVRTPAVNAGFGRARSTSAQAPAAARITTRIPATHFVRDPSGTAGASLGPEPSGGLIAVCGAAD